jgi:hypothetical protein
MRRTIDHGPPTALAIQPIALVQRAFPEKPGCIRRIHKLWGKTFRINYHSVEDGYAIHESHFVEVIDGKVAEQN